MHKLNERETICLKSINELAQMDEKSKPTLDFEANIRFPGVANVVKIQNNDEFCIHLMANSDIGVGKTIIGRSIVH